jgi:hypothetical protein
MATYTPLQSVVLTSDTASVTFSGIDQTYTDLIILANQYVKFNSAGSAGVFLRFNGSSAAYYSTTALFGTGSSALSARNSNQTRGQVAQTYTSTASTITKFNPAIIQIQNYSNTTTYKTTIGRGSAADGIVDADVMLWRGSTGSSTEAITSIEISTDGTTFYAGSTFDLYGIKSGTAKAQGGNVIISDGTYFYHVFRTSGIFTVQNAPLTCEVLTIAGGAGCVPTGTGAGPTGGGGAGGVVYTASQALVVRDHVVAVGAGGALTGGNNSQFFGLTAAVGGGRGGFTDQVGETGGSGGGSGGRFTNSGGLGTVGQGNNGGAGREQSGLASGGGGGAGTAGSTAGNNAGGAGGNGTSTYSTWATTTGTGVSGVYAGGGGGASWYTGNGGAGGSGGGGQGQSGSTGTNATNGTAATGSGGGGSGFGTNGGSGIVIVRYPV